MIDMCQLKKVDKSHLLMIDKFHFQMTKKCQWIADDWQKPHNDDSHVTFHDD